MELDQRLRKHLYDEIVAHGRLSPNREIAAALGVGVAEIEEALVRLEAMHALALAPGSRNPWMLHPFSTAPTSFPVEAEGKRYWANCAWDALSIPSLLKRTATARGKCADCNETMFFEFRDGELEGGDGLVHFVVPPRRFWENVAFT
jgi:DNA-binding transcriptional MocR family regulator